MYMNKSVVYLFVSVFFLFTSCEYQLGENFVEMEKLPSDSVTLSVDFYGLAYYQAENAYVIEHSGSAACEVYPLPGFKVEKLVVRLGEMEWESDEARCDFMLDVDRIPNGSYELSCEIFSRTNSGTVAGQVGTSNMRKSEVGPLRSVRVPGATRSSAIRWTKADIPKSSGMWMNLFVMDLIILRLNIVMII